MKTREVSQDEKRAREYGRRFLKRLQAALPPELPIGTHGRAGSFSFHTPDGRRHTALVAKYCYEPTLIMRLYLNHFTPSALRIAKDDAPAGDVHLELSFAPSETDAVADWVATWMPRLHEPVVPITYPMAPHPNVEAENLIKVGYVWTAEGETLYEAALKKAGKTTKGRPSSQSHDAT